MVLDVRPERSLPGFRSGDAVRSYRACVAVDEIPHTHAHTHGSGGFVSGWEGWRRDRALVTIVAVLAVCAIATLIAAVLVRGDGTQRDQILTSADEVGFVSEVVTAEVVTVTDATCSFAGEEGGEQCRTFELRVTGGDRDGQTITLPEFSLAFDQTVPRVGVGDPVVLDYEPTTDTYTYADRDRRTSLLLLTALFAVVVIALARWRGVLALVAMFATVVVLVGFVAPAVLDGSDPLVVAVVAASMIAFVSLFLTHGVTPSTAVALVSTLAALALTLALSKLFFELAGFTGLASEEATVLPLLGIEIDLADLLLGGAVIGALGALDDVTVTQVATVAELREQRSDLSWRQLSAAGIRIGRSHIAATVNTLLLAYAGASIPLLLLFSASSQSLGFVANSEVVAVEIVRTMCGSIGLVAAVPVATGLAAVVVTSASTRPEEATEPAHEADWEDFAPDREFWE